jgi:hypothetical protein
VPLQHTYIERSEVYSKPLAGRTMLGLLKKYGRRLHRAHTILTDEIQNTSWPAELLKEVLFFRYSSEKDEVVMSQKSSLISSSLLLNWICGRILNRLPFDASLTDAESWFHNLPQNQCISNVINLRSHESVLDLLQQIDIPSLIEAMPYLAEVFETGNEIPDEKGIERKKKKDNGIYYTPTDVIDFIVRHSIGRQINTPLALADAKWYDPALGTGSFLLGVLRFYGSVENSSNEQIVYFEKNLFGTDISPHALQSASYIIATSCINGSTHLHLKEAAILIGRNLALIDATTITSIHKLAKVFPNMGNQGANFIVSNPPYAKKRESQLSLFSEKQTRQAKSSEELYPEFIKILLDLSNVKDGGGGMVVPLSLAASSKEKFKSLRKYIQSRKGTKEFWNFDRTPDSLFGDDVKTRNTIFFFNNSPSALNYNKIYSSYLHRWNSRKREHLFHTISIACLGEDVDIVDGVPKVGDKFGVQLLERVRKTNSGTINEFLKVSQIKPQIFTKQTAYNWLPIELSVDSEEDQIQKLNKVGWEITDKGLSSYAVYAVLSSRITYWLWRVWSDGFHLTNQFICNLPFGLPFFKEIDKEKLSELGNQLWSKSKEEQITTRNAGIESTVYCSLKHNELLDQIDEIVLTFFDLPNSSTEYFKEFINKLIVAGREEELSTYKKMNYLEPIR